MYWIIHHFPIIPAVFSVVIACISYFRGEKHRAVVRFAMMNLAIGAWNLSEFLKGLSVDPSFMLLWAKAARASGCLMFTFCLHFIIAYTDSYTKLNKRILGLAYVTIIMLIVSLFHPTLFVRGVERLKYGVIALPGPLYYVYFSSYLTFFIYSFFVLGRYAVKCENRIEKNKAGYLFLFGLFATVLGLSHFLHIISGPQMPPLGHIGTFVFSVAIFYVIFRYQIMDITLAIRKGLILTGTIAVLSVLYLILVLSSDKIIFTLTGQSNKLWTYFSVMLFAILFQPFQKKIHEFGSRKLFPVRHYYQKFFNEFGNELSGYNEIDKLVSDLIRNLHQYMTFENVAFYIVNKDFQRLELAGYVSDKSPRPSEYLEKTAGPEEIMIEQELTNRLSVEVLDESGKNRILGMIRFLRRARSSMAVPVKSKGETLGLLLFGQKKIYNIIDYEDVEILRLISERTGAAMAKIMTEQRAKEAEQLAEVGKLSATIAHEIKNPLGAIKSSAQLLRDGKGSDVQTGIILEESERLNRILMEYLDFSRPAKLSLEETAWEGYLDRVFKLFDHKGVDILPGPETKPPMVKIDPDKIKQVIFNLLNNAVRSAGEGGQVSMRRISADGFTGLRVEDSGPGFSHEAMKNAFRPFYTTHEQGTGLGLSVAKKILEEHGGRIEIGNLENESGAFAEILVPLLEK